MAYHVETTADGATFVRRSHSHRHHHRRHSHHSSEYVRVPENEWQVLVERARDLREANEALVGHNDCLERENDSLKSYIRDAEAEVARRVARLEGRVASVVAENTGLRKSAEEAADLANKHFHEAERLRRLAKKLEDANAALEAEVHRLQHELERERLSDHHHHHRHDHCRHHAAVGWKRKIEELRETIVGWRTRAEDGADKIDEYKHRLDRAASEIKHRDRLIEKYEKKLRRQGLL